jgi:hypothetical protein
MGKHQVGAMTSAERRTQRVYVARVLPGCPHKRQRFKFELSTGAPPGKQFACTENGWITNDVFVQWLKHCIQTTKPSKETKLLLLLDGHITHTKKTFKL